MVPPGSVHWLHKCVCVSGMLLWNIFWPWHHNCCIHWLCYAGPWFIFKSLNSKSATVSVSHQNHSTTVSWPLVICYPWHDLSLTDHWSLVSHVSGVSLWSAERWCLPLHCCIRTLSNCSNNCSIIISTSVNTLEHEICHFIVASLTKESDFSEPSIVPVKPVVKLGESSQGHR